MKTPTRQIVAPDPRAPIMDAELVRPDRANEGARDPKLLWLDKNENPDPEVALLISRVLAKVPATALYAYPELGPLYRKLAAFLNVGPDRLLLTAGCDGAIRAVFEAYIDPGDVVVHTQPTFVMYTVYARMYGARSVTLEYRPSNAGPILNGDAVLDTVLRVRPKLVCVPNPDSPTGTVIEPGTLRRIIEAAGQVGAIILIDEAYHPFYEHTVLPWVDEYPHLVVARTFAKAWGLAGLRIGYAAACPALTVFLHKVRPMYEVNGVAAAVVERMLDFGSEVLAGAQRINAGRDAFYSAMTELGLPTHRSHGNFVHVAFGPHAAAVHAGLKDLVLYRQDSREPCLRGFSRFTAARVEVLLPVIDRVRQVILERP